MNDKPVYNTLSEAAREEAFRSISSGLIILTPENLFVEANPVALDLFPSLETLSPGSPLPDDVRETVRGLLDKKKHDYTANGRTYECKSHDLIRDGILIGNVIRFSDITEHRERVKTMWKYQEDLEEMFDEKVRRIIDMQSRVMLGMAEIIENRDGNTGGHVKRTSKTVELMAKAMLEDGYPGVTPSFCQIMTGTAPMHDLGKLSIADQILRKPGKLTDEEFGVMKSHSEKGHEIIDKMLTGVEDDDALRISENIALYHHERWDGHGYPHHLAGEEIPLEARVMAIADVYDAIVSRRCYKDPIPFSESNEIMLSSFGTQFDPSLKKYYEQCRPEMEAFYMAQNDGDIL